VFAIIAMLVTAQTDFQILSTLNGRDLERSGIQADLLAVPDGFSEAEFADRLIADSGLVGVNGSGSTTNNGDAVLQIRSLFTPDGPTIVVYFAQGGRYGRKVCRIRGRDAGASLGRYRAFRWCNAAFGVSMPVTPPPPVVVMPGR
jgi:hypothetical protein